jgi:hypothetical protein
VVRGSHLGYLLVPSWCNHIPKTLTFHKKRVQKEGQSRKGRITVGKKGVGPSFFNSPFDFSFVHFSYGQCQCLLGCGCTNQHKIMQRGGPFHRLWPRNQLKGPTSCLFFLFIFPCNRAPIGQKGKFLSLQKCRPAWMTANLLNSILLNFRALSK